MSGEFHLRLPNPRTAASRLAERRPKRVLIVGPMGTGKSTLASAAAARCRAQGLTVTCIGADPGTPAFGLPGAVSLGVWGHDGWRAQRMEPLCSLDAARFRLPLVAAAGRLAAQAQGDLLVVDAPGVVRGVAGAELLLGLAEAVSPEVLIWLAPSAGASGLAQELGAVSAERWRVEAAPAAVRPPAAARARARTALWERYMQAAEPVQLPLTAVNVLGTPPPEGVPDAWRGRQVACLGAGGEARYGEVEGLEKGVLSLRLVPGDEPVERLVIRDTGRDADGILATRRRAGTPGRPEPVLRPAGPALEVGPASLVLVNGLFGDPLVHLRLRHRRRSLLFDLGETRALPTRVLHQVTDVFVSHAHADHIGGFVGFLRARIGSGGSPCRLFGPPGLAWNVEGFVRGIHWDRIGGRAPVFQVIEIHDDTLRRFRVEAGVPGPAEQGSEVAADGGLLAEADFRVRGVTLDHGTPVIAYAFEPRAQANVRKDRLQALGLTPGRWLTELKRAWLAGQDAASVDLPGGGRRSVADLADDLLMAAPGRRVVYATDLADTPDNRARLTALAAGAHTLICEAAFAEQDAGQARYTGHLTARACGEIAAAAGVRQIVPCHFSARYEKDAERIYREVAAACAPGIRMRRHENQGGANERIRQTESR